MNACIFCKIIAGDMDVKTEFLYTDSHLVVFKDINPKASLHLLVVPKKHIKSLADVTKEDEALLGHMLYTLPKIANMHHVKGFRTIINTGREGGQVVDHIHLHLLADNKLPEF